MCTSRSGCCYCFCFLFVCGVFVLFVVVCFVCRYLLFFVVVFSVVFVFFVFCVCVCLFVCFLIVFFWSNGVFVCLFWGLGVVCAGIIFFWYVFQYVEQRVRAFTPTRSSLCVCCVRRTMKSIIQYVFHPRSEIAVHWLEITKRIKTCLRYNSLLWMCTLNQSHLTRYSSRNLLERVVSLKHGTYCLK